MILALFTRSRQALDDHPEDGRKRHEWLLRGPYPAQSQLLTHQVSPGPGGFSTGSTAGSHG